MSTEKEIYRALRELQARHTYFLLTAAAGGIALAAIQIYGTVLARLDLALGLAVTSWALSFFFGCRYVDQVFAELYLNREVLRVRSGEYPGIDNNPALVTLAEKRIRRAMRGNSERMSSFVAWQFRLLIVGGILYVAWLVLGMYFNQTLPAKY